MSAPLPTSPEAEPRDPSPESRQTASDVAGRAGRGGVAVLAAKVFFIVSGLGQQAGLQYALGKRDYGKLGLVFAAANIVNNVLVSGSTLGVSRAVASSRDDGPGALRSALKIHAPIAAIAAALFALVAPLYARFEKRPDIVGPMLVLSGVVLIYGLYAPLVGSLNGRGLFGKQAALDVLTMTLRTVGMVTCALVFQRVSGAGVLGTALGFLAAALVVLAVATRVTGTGREPLGAKLDGRAYLRALGPLVLAQLFVNLVMQADIVLVGRFLVEAAQATGLRDRAASDAADAWVGVYRCCQLFAFLPYQLLLSLTLVLFPTLAAARAEGDSASVRRYVARGARLGAIATGALVALVAATPESTLHFLYSADIASEGAPVLRLLAIAQGIFGLLAIASTILASLGQERKAAAVTFLALAVSAGACTLVVPHAAFGQPQLLAAATAVGGALLFALLVAAALVRRAAGAFVPWTTAARVAVALACTVAAGSQLPASGRMLSIVVSAVMFALYFAVLVATRELRREDLAAIAGALRRRAKRA